MATDRVSLKLVVDKSKRTVIFAEAGKEFVDFLLHLLVLPVGQAVQLLTKTGVVGSLSNLYGSVEKLPNVYIKSSEKDAILKPKAPACVSKLPFLLADTTPRTYYKCSSGSYSYGGPCPYVAEDPSAKCPKCKSSMNFVCTLVKSPADKPSGFVEGEVTYMMTDDLTVKPTSTASSIALLKKFNVEEIGLIEEMVVSLGMAEVSPCH
ncbi:hypothetical protein BT93_I0296 [Corymbia citriodora subsp. variegata]|nr:hypothetical protein BT93_I0296 [Corymbia citriodora subsp. variegata]